ncbi:hypothetical protein Thiowin_02094 [Thiorhodovibrio winogradskyi]|uniref:Uncharacterized protein n=1 Tax=Thiorhodovibrio winogradskyi TaxID=77007 RepID=A0ABZ0S807_9GAMM|nr:hypothetical protein [Thiorhodovibrio winogradskyi]
MPTLLTMPTTNRKHSRCPRINQLPRAPHGPRLRSPAIRGRHGHSMLTSVVIVGLVLAGLLWLPPAESLSRQWPVITPGVHR